MLYLYLLNQHKKMSETVSQPTGNMSSSDSFEMQQPVDAIVTPLTFISTEALLAAANSSLPYDHQPYPVVENLEQHLLPMGEEGGPPAVTYMSSILPSETFTVLSNKGTSSVVLSDGKGRVYKVRRNAADYTYIEQEAESLARFQDLGLGPRFDVLVDAGVSFRTDISNSSMRQRSPVPTLVPRVDAQGQLPVLIMEQIDATPIKMLDRETLGKEFLRLLDITIENDLHFSDVEFVFDNQAQIIRMIDVNGAHVAQARHKYSINMEGEIVGDSHPTLSDEAFVKAQSAWTLIRHFLDANPVQKNMPSVEDVDAIITAGGQEALVGFI